ncbi:MAG: mechanosensitive ion channel [bacterium]|nr:mechanosensitive ion channel [bacterium]
MQRVSHRESRMSTSSLCTALRLFAVLVLCGAPLAAQQPEPEVALPVELSPLDKARQTLAALEQTTERTRELATRTRATSGDERELARIEGLELLDDLRDLTGELLKAIPSLDDSPEAVESLRGEVAECLRYQGQLVLSHRQHRSRELADLRRKRAKVAVEDSAELEDGINTARETLDLGQKVGLEVVQRLETLGRPDDELHAELRELFEERADSLTMRLQLATASRDRLQQQFDSAKKAGASAEQLELRTRVRAVSLRADGIVKSLQKTADLLQKWDVDTSEYRQALILATGEITEDVLDTEVLVGLFGEGLRKLYEWILDRGPTLIFQLVVVVLFVVLFRWAGLLLWVGVRMILRPTKLLAGMVGRMIRPLATLIGLISGLWFLGANPAALLTGVGVAGVIVGFALQESLGSLAAGVFILVYRPYDEGDTVNVGGIVGTVKEMGLANTTIITFDNRRVFVPNRKVWGEVIENRSAEPTRRVEATVRIAYHEEVERAMTVIRELLGRHELVLEDPEPVVFVSKLDESHVELAVRPWTRVENWWPLMMDLQRVLTIGLREAGFEVPYPRRRILGDGVQPASDGD